jgi:hypothetical protein
VRDAPVLCHALAQAPAELADRRVMNATQQRGNLGLFEARMAVQ